MKKTADEMRISDWSSDVCSSDLRLQRRGIIPAARGRDRGLHRAGLLPDRLGELSRRKAELLHQPEGFALLDRPRLLVVAKKKHARAGVVADLQDPLRLPAPELARLVDDQDMTIGDIMPAAAQQRGDSTRVDGSVLAQLRGRR